MKNSKWRTDMKRRGFLKFLGASPAAAPAVAKALEPKDVEFEAMCGQREAAWK